MQITLLDFIKEQGEVLLEPIFSEMENDPRELQIRHNVEANRFEAELSGKMAFAEYRLDGDKIIIYHTEVPEEFRGRKIAAKLVTAALCAAREKGFKVVPECSYVARFIDEHQEYADLVASA